MIRNSLICKLINVQASMKEINEKNILDEHEISKHIKASPKDIKVMNLLLFQASSKCYIEMIDTGILYV